MGSGSLHATTILESKYKDDMSREEAVQLCIEAITAGIYHDLGSGSNVDYCVLTKDKTEMFRNAVLNKDLHEISLG
jgi:20S proteasome subunit beta 2